MSGMDEFAPYKDRINGCFIIKNTCHDRNKTIKVFHYPILKNDLLDLIKLPGVSEASIRASLLKGELRNKIRYQEIQVICSDIDLLQFNSDQKAFLQSAGIVNGLEVSGGGGGFPFFFRFNKQLIGPINDVNRTFTAPDKFLNGIFSGHDFRIGVYHNGRKLQQDVEYFVSESGGIGTGYDTINLNFSPRHNSVLIANYVIS